MNLLNQCVLKNQPINGTVSGTMNCDIQNERFSTGNVFDYYKRVYIGKFIKKKQIWTRSQSIEFKTTSKQQKKFSSTITNINSMENFNFKSGFI